MRSRKSHKLSKGSRKRSSPAPTRKQMITLNASLNRAKRERDIAMREGRRLKNSLLVRNRVIRDLGMKLKRARRR